MTSQSSKHRRKMKQENPDAYRIYLDKQKFKSKQNRDRMKQMLLENPTDEIKRKRERQLELARERKRKWSEKQMKGKERKRRKKRTSTQVQEDARSEGSEEQNDIATKSMDHPGNSNEDAGEKSGSETGHDLPQSDQDDNFVSVEKTADNTIESEAWNSRLDFSAPTSEDDTAFIDAQQVNPLESSSILRPLSPETRTSQGNRTEGDIIMHDTIQLHRTSLTILDQPYTMTSGPGHGMSNIANTSLNGSLRDVTHDNTPDANIQQSANQERGRSSEDDNGNSLEYESRISSHEPSSSFIQENSHRQRDLNEILLRTSSTFQNIETIRRMDNDPVLFDSNIPLHSRLPLPLTPGNRLLRPIVLTPLDNRNITHNNSLEGIIHQSPSVQDSDQYHVRGFQSRSNLYPDLNQWPGLQSDNEPNTVPTTSSVFGTERIRRSSVLYHGSGIVPYNFPPNQTSQMPLTLGLNMPVNGNILSGTLQFPPNALNPVNLSLNEAQRNNSMPSRDIVEPNSHPTPYRRFINQQETQSSNTERQQMSTTCQHHREPANIACIDCDRKLICRLCLPNHYKHKFTAFKRLQDAIVKTDEVEFPFDLFCVQRIFSLRESLYFWEIFEKTLVCYDIVDKKMRKINLTCDDGDRIIDIYLSPDRKELWYCTKKGSVYQMSVRDESCALKFTCDTNHLIHYYRRMCVTRGNRVLLYVRTRGYLDEQDDSDTSDTDSDEGDTECCYIMVYTTDGQLQSRHLIERQKDVDIDCIRECSITGDILIVIINGYKRKVLLTDEKLDKKYEISGQSVRYHTGGRQKKRTGYSRSWSIIRDACFDAEGNILLSLNNHEVILMDHDTGMYIRTVFTPDYVWCVITVQEDGVLWCRDRYCFGKKQKLTSVKYLDKL